MNTNRIQTIFYGGDHAEDTDRTGQGAGVSHNVISWRGNPVTTRCRHAAHRYNHRLTRCPGCCQFSANHFRRGNAAARAINTQDNRFHFRVKASVADLCRSGITANIPLSFLAIHNCAISEDDTDAVTGICRRFQCVIVITDGAIIFISLTPAELFGQSFFDFGTRCQCIDQLVFQCIFRGIATGFG